MRYFVAVAEERSFRKAADRLLISTPTLSQQIKAVEREIGAALLIRGTRGVELTTAGEVLLRTARTTIAAADAAVAETRQAAGVVAPVLRFGLVNGMPVEVVQRVERALTAGLPGSRLAMTGGTTAQLGGLLAAGLLDVAVQRAPVDPAPGFRQALLAEEELGVLMSRRHPLAADGDGGDSGEITVADLAGRELMLFAQTSAPGLHEAILAKLPGVVLSPSAMGHAQMLPLLAARPDVVGLSSERAAGTPGLVFRRLRGRPLVVSYLAVWHAANRSPALRAAASAWA